eukprot:TRINITY_DN97330_c0_g1_i1.p1 TRINITY_DN97330_c0_g1~~TRINITY_DN97330_c0_g1_i1.p1  ORF type:complete len:253 (-),score=-35.14 TRINITY_DN97330_c0_g1_i1:108-866(-)
MKKILFILLSISIFSCSDNNDPKPGTNHIVPLGIGYYWVYDEHSYDEKGDLINSKESKFEITGSSLHQINGKEVELYHRRSYGQDLVTQSDFYWYYSNDEDGLNVYGGNYKEKEYILGKSTLIKYPISPNESWRRNSYYATIVVDEISFDKEETYEITNISTSETINTPLGNITCHKYHHQVLGQYGILMDHYAYYAENIGYIGYELYSEGTLRHKKILKEYSLKENLSASKAKKEAKSKKKNESVIPIWLY